MPLFRRRKAGSPVVSDTMPAWASGRRVRRRPRNALLPWLQAALLLAALGITVLLAQPETAWNGRDVLAGPVERVSDGDTLVVAGQRIRLVGLDAPEWDQTCRTATGEAWACGAAATDRLRALTRRYSVECRPQGRDRYQRLLATCSRGADDIAEQMVRDGLAVADGRYGAAEREARSAHRGIWQGSFDTPSAWRAGAGRSESGEAANPSRFERFIDWLTGVFIR